ncbi:hypothetical protein OHA70_13170 [Kribbella sp. NBC_00382]|uniref:hypothetical protein n=1 Tax=Kribbella sp. NBC_00382 TaxID=2975967 RepID=UPI002E21D779
MNATPELHGYELDQRLLEHPLAEIWRGRSFTGMEIVALVLSDRGAADPQVRDRLTSASRTAALEPHEQQTPLWAANLTADRPYAVTQLVPGQSGAERLLDPLDGLLGNDQESVDAVRSQLAQYGALPVPTDQEPSSQDAVASSQNAAVANGQKAVVSSKRWWPRLLAVLAVLGVFCALYSVGTKIGTETKEQRPAVPAPAPLVSPEPLPSPGPLHAPK